jgi:small subunit ribosomal protein S6
LKRLYECMILADNNKAREHAAEVEAEMKGMIERFGGTVVNMERWEERKLAYEVRHAGARHKRASYYLTHFEVDPAQVSRIERAFGLSEAVLRAMIIQDEDGPAVLRPKDYEEVTRIAEEGRPAGPREGGDAPAADAGER